MTLIRFCIIIWMVYKFHSNLYKIKILNILYNKTIRSKCSLTRINFRFKRRSFKSTYQGQNLHCCMFWESDQTSSNWKHKLDAEIWYSGELVSRWAEIGLCRTCPLTYLNAWLDQLRWPAGQPARINTGSSGGSRSWKQEVWTLPFISSVPRAAEWRRAFKLIHSRSLKKPIGISECVRIEFSAPWALDSPWLIDFLCGQNYVRSVCDARCLILWPIDRIVATLTIRQTFALDIT